MIDLNKENQTLFSEPNSFTIEVTQADIDASETVFHDLAHNPYKNSLAKAIQRLNGSLPGQNAPQDGIIYAQTEIRTGIPFISICDVFVLTCTYRADDETVVKIALENLADQLPTKPYKVKLRKV